MTDREQIRRDDFDTQNEKNLRILKLIREDHGWALARILRAEELEVENVRLRDHAEQGRLILGPCFVCGLPALEAIEQAKKENAEDALRWGKANQALILEREQATTRAAKAEWDLEAEKTRGIDPKGKG